MGPFAKRVHVDGRIMQVGPILWRYCHILRHDGVDYGQYLDQLTYLLFLKMWDSDESATDSSWATLERAIPSEILTTYERELARLANRDDLVGAIFAGARSEFTSGDALARLIKLIDELRWNDLDRDVQADAFEYLLEQAAAEGKKGAGQYFTPRSLMRSIVACVKPGAVSTDVIIGDPAAGTGGFLITANEWATDNIPQRRALRYWGRELVQRPRRLALMNAMLHGLDGATIELGDALAAETSAVSADVILANPPFGSQGSQIPPRGDFWFRTSNKQANFIQQIALSLSEVGRAAVVVPDNCLFGDVARGLMPELVQRVDLHTVLRLPDGTFSPYTSGTRTNVLFFTNARPTTSTWIYDARTREHAGRRPLEKGELDEFVKCFGTDPLSVSHRTESDSAAGRWKRFDLSELRDCAYEIDRLPWRMATPPRHQANHLKPLLEARAEMESALRQIDALVQQLEAS